MTKKDPSLHFSRLKKKKKIDKTRNYILKEKKNIMS